MSLVVLELSSLTSTLIAESFSTDLSLLSLFSGPIIRFSKVIVPFVISNRVPENSSSTVIEYCGFGFQIL